MRSASCVRYSSRLIEVKLSIRKRSKMGGAHGPACAERDYGGRPGARPSEGASAGRGPKFLRSRPSSDLSFNVACQTDERACSTLNGPLLHNKDVEVPTGGTATGPLPATRPCNTACFALNICGGSTFIFELGKPARCRNHHEFVLHTCCRCAIGTGHSRYHDSG